MLGNRYEIVSPLARGGMAKLYLAMDNHLQQQVVVKASQEKELEQEALMQRKLAHPAFPSVYDLIQEQDITYLVMEYIEGITLTDYVKQNGAMEESLALEIGMQLAEILRDLHEKRPAMIYQDCKPDNILLQRDGRIRLIDLGATVQQTYDGTKVKTIGTKGYAAPEQEAGEQGEISCQSDIYGWGAVLYTLVTGICLNVPPYRIENIAALCPELTRKTLYLIARATKPNRADRFQSMEEMLSVLRGKAVTREIKSFERANRKGSKPTYQKTLASVFLTQKEHPGLV